MNDCQGTTIGDDTALVGECGSPKPHGPGDCPEPAGEQEIPLLEIDDPRAGIIDACFPS